MPIKKRTFKSDEIAIYDEAVIYKRGDYWQFRMWLAKEDKYARFSLRTRSQSTAEDKAKQHFHAIKASELQGKRYFSLTTKAGVEMYLQQRWKDVEAGLIVSGRYTTIKTHLAHWLDFIGRDTKLKELERTDCENYYSARTKTKNNISISQTTVLNEQSSINAMMLWLYKRKETYIDSFEFKKLKRIDRGDETLRRAMFDDEEMRVMRLILDKQIADAKKNIDEGKNLEKAVTSYYLMIASMTGLRRGEQLQLRWGDVEFIEHVINGDEDNSHSLVKLTIRAEISKVRKTRSFAIRDREYFDELFKILQPRYVLANKDNPNAKAFGNTLVFSINGKNPITPRAITYHFDKLLTEADISRKNRDLVPYSFRHYFITQRINSGLGIMAVAEMCGTGITQIENTYYHTTKDKMISNAMADYYYKDGVFYPTSY
jgi:integrase